MNCCNEYGQCTRGHNCPAGPNSYRSNFTQLGEPIDQTPPWTAPDFLMVLLAVLCIVGLVSGAFK